MSHLQVQLNDYVAMRRATGFKFVQAARLLSNFVDHLERHGSDVVTSTAAISWASAAGGHPNWWARRLSLVGGFARYLRDREPGHEVPPPGLFPTRPSRATPYLYTDEDIGRLMEAARSLRTSWGRTMETLIGLLAVTGMRVGEAIRLDVTDIDWEGGLLVVRSTKFGKSREVALHATAVAALRSYGDERLRLGPRLRTSAFLVSTHGDRLAYDSVQKTFHRLVVRLGFPRPTERYGPRLHDLRHTFVVRTIVDWYRGGVDVAQRLHRLSTYLGHFDPSSTYWYLSAAPDAFGRLLRNYAATAARQQPSLTGKTVTPHVLRHTCAMELLKRGIDTSVIALWLGHEGVETTQIYLHADMTLKERALGLTTQPKTKASRYRPPDALLAFLAAR